MTMSTSMQEFVGLIPEVSHYSEELNDGAVFLTFFSGCYVRATYWRLLEADGTRISSFDHRQRYDLPAELNAVTSLEDALRGHKITSAELNETSGDLCFTFGNSARWQVFGFTAYEIWEVGFGDGRVQYSNHI